MGELNRRDFLRAAGMGVLGAAFAGSAMAATASDKPPNVIIILADDLGYGDLAFQNADSKIPTPNIDRLAAQGMHFTDAHSPSAVCSPTRYGILTGRYCWRGDLKEQVLWQWDRPILEEGRLTFGRMLQRQGYNTACIGKWHLGWTWPTTDGSSINETVPIGVHDKLRNTFGDKVDFTKPITDGPTARGFDYYFGDDVPNFAPRCFIENDRVLEMPTEEKPEGMFGTPGPTVPGWKLEAVMPAITKKAVDYIKASPDDAPFNKRAGEPFFLYFPLTAPHTPIAPTEEFIGKSEAYRYGDYVNEVDWTVGEIMKALDESGQAENTLVFFTSDNGSPGRDGENMSGQPRSVTKYGHNPSYIFRGIKTDIWDGGHHVPLIARWPGHIAGGSASDDLVCLVDLMATVAGITGYGLPNDAAEDSYNMLPVLEGQHAGEPIRDAIVHHSFYGMFAIRQGPWKLVIGEGSGGWGWDRNEKYPPGQLYNMVDDPKEEHDLFGERPEIVARLQELLQTYRTEGRSAPLR